MPFDGYPAYDRPVLWNILHTLLLGCEEICFTVMSRNNSHVDIKPAKNISSSVVTKTEQFNSQIRVMTSSITGNSTVGSIALRNTAEKMSNFPIAVHLLGKSRDDPYGHCFHGQTSSCVDRSEIKRCKLLIIPLRYRPTGGFIIYKSMSSHNYL